MDASRTTSRTAVTGAEGGAPPSAPWNRWRATRAILASPRIVAIVLGAAVFLLAVAGIGFAASEARLLAPFDLDGEANVPALLSSLVLLASAVALLRLRVRLRPSPVPTLVAALLVFAAVDEATYVHERLEETVQFDWQAVYLPGAILAAVLWALLLADLRRAAAARVLMIAGGALWLGSQMLELVQWDGDRRRPGYTAKMVVEELSELTGSVLLLLAFLRAYEHLAPSGASRPAAHT